MPALVAGIHLFPSKKQDVDGRAFASPKGLRPRRRVEPGHEEEGRRFPSSIQLLVVPEDAVLIEGNAAIA
jgi:hypothetical protein